MRPRGSPRYERSRASRPALALFLLDFLLDGVFCPDRLPDQDRNQRPEDEDLLERAVEKRRVAFEQPDHDRPDGGRGITDQPADDRADEGFEADEEAGVVIERGDRSDQDAGDA